MSNMLGICLLVILSCVQIINGAKILAIMTIASPSHHIWNRALIDELARKGHDVTYFSPDHDKNFHSNVRQILAEDVYTKLHAEINIEDMVKNTKISELIADLDEFGIGNCKHVIESKGFEKLLEIVKKETFNLIIFDFSINECVLPIANELKGVPIVGVSPFGGTPISHSIAGNPEMLAIRPIVFLPFSANMTLLERIKNVLVHYYYMYDRHFYYLPKEVELARTRFPNVKKEDIDGVIDRFSLLLVNNHFSIDPPIPTVPGLIHVGGLQVKPPKALPEDLQKFLDESTHGAIFFSLGSNLKSSKLSEDKKKIILESLKELAPIRVLWKFEVELPGKPENVMIRKWLPQNDILAHPNVKLFFTHSGLLSTQETIYHGKPIVGMPFLVDQHININKCMREGLGEKIDFLTMDKKTLVGTIKKVWNDPKYFNRAQELSKIFKDRPHTPLQTAVYWVEYVIRHKGAPHLKCATLRLNWYQNQLLDVYLILGAGLVITLLIIYKVLKYFLGFFFKSNVKENKLKKQ